MPQKWYVCFEGRKPGVYDNWAECKKQVHTYPNNLYQSYPTKDAANTAWRAWCLDNGVEADVNNEGGVRNTQGVHEQFVNPTQPWVGSHDGSSHVGVGGSSIAAENLFLDQVRDPRCLLQFSMQDWLRQACNSLGIVQPTYRRGGVQAVNGVPYFRYHGSLRTGRYSDTIVCISRFTPTEELAREDVAVMLLRELVSTTGLQIYDFNYHNIYMAQEQVNMLGVENYDVVRENELLKEQLARLAFD